MSLDLSRYSRIVVLTGAGISAGSGLRTYRDPDGVWKEHDIGRFGHASALTEHPDACWRLFGAMCIPVLAARPHAAHVALAHRESGLRAGQEFLLVTQNVDGLHQRAGSSNVVDLHGNILYTRCSDHACGLERHRGHNGGGEAG